MIIAVNKLFTVMGVKLKFSAQGRDLALFVGNVTKSKIPSEIKTPLIMYRKCKTINCLTFFSLSSFTLKDILFLFFLIQYCC